MKKYFVKYLPVEGEIKEGDWISDGHNIGKCLDRNGDVITPSMYGGLFNFKEFKKVKLFLCTRDIQVGDICYWDDGIWDKYSGGKVLYGDPIKVIGGVSPDAIWVKEGDKFDKNELTWIISDTLKGWIELPFDEGNKLIKSTHQVPGEYIKIKGPCGHFH